MQLTFDGVLVGLGEIGDRKGTVPMLEQGNRIAKPILTSRLACPALGWHGVAQERSVAPAARPTPSCVRKRRETVTSSTLRRHAVQARTDLTSWKSSSNFIEHIQIVSGVVIGARAGPANHAA
eukprot:358859-Chlamydomonas_euryale.AAC.1